MVRHSPASVNLATYARRTTLQDMDVESLFEGKLRPIHTLSTRKNSQVKNIPINIDSIITNTLY